MVEYHAQDSVADNSINAALAPVRAGLLRQACAEAAKVLADAERDAQQLLTEARASADAMLAAARARGQAEASVVPLSTIERHLMQHQLGDGAAGAVRAVADRTRDLVPAVVRVFTFLHPDIGVGDTAERTMARLELGLPVELVELGMVFGSALARPQYLSLLERGLTTPDQFEAADDTTLTDCLDATKSRVVELQTLLQERKKQQDDALTPLLPAPTE